MTTQTVRSRTASIDRRWIRAFGLALGLALLWTAAAMAAPRTRSFSESFPATGATVRLANLAGHVELAMGSGNEVRVEATVHAEGRSAAETQKLLDGMKWVAGKDRKGRDQWSLTYPVDDYRGFHYPGQEEDDGSIWWKLLNTFNVGKTTSTYLGERVTLYGTRSSSVPTLYTDLTITLPRGADLAVRNVVGEIVGGELEGSLDLDTGSGGVELAGFSGTLVVDTGSGSVRLGWVRGESNVDTGSGAIRIGELIGNGDFDTGSGSIRVDKVAAGRLIADTGSGSIEISDGSVGNLDADTGSGSIRVLGVDVETFVGDTGSGGVTLESPLTRAKSVDIDTGSGSVKIVASRDASFDLDTSLGSGNLVVRYDDAELRKRGHKLVGAKRGSGQTRIRVETGSGGCTIGPAG